MKLAISLIISVVFVIFFISFVSSEIIINQQPKEIYNFGDVITIPVTIKSLNELSGVLEMELICEGQKIDFYKNGVGLSAGEEKRTEAQLVLTRVIIKELKGDCKIKIMLNDDYVITNDFVISDLLSVRKTSEMVEFEPGGDLYIKGNAIKESGGGANGFITMKVIDGNTTIMEHLETIRDGFFLINISLPKDMRAGTYLVNLEAKEIDLDALTTNHGGSSFSMSIKQVPTSLEIFIENAEVNPGENAKIKAILHDQTGGIMPSMSFITVKDGDGIIREQTEKTTGEFLEIPIMNNEPPAVWTVLASSNKLDSEMDFIIKEKEEAKVELINKTVIITNIGNVPYNKSVLINIENDSIPFNVSLEVDESKKYFLTAPDGDYEVEIMTQEGSKITGMATLTGKEIAILEPSEKIKGTFKKFFIWFFIILILGFVVFIVFRKVRKKNFFGFVSRISSKKKGKKGKIPVAKEGLFKGSKSKGNEKLNLDSNPKERAELSLSIKGEKQDVSMVCLKIKNLKEIGLKEDVREILKKITEISKEHKTVRYESQNMIFFMFVPLKTRTFRNEQSALKLAQEIKENLVDHNKLFKHKIEFGISLNHGSVVAKQEKSTGGLKFMALGTLMPLTKRIASVSDEEILLSERMNERISRFAKTEKKEIDKLIVYRIKEMKVDNEEHKKFIRNFLKRIEKK